MDTTRHRAATRPATQGVLNDRLLGRTLGHLAGPHVIGSCLIAACLASVFQPVRAQPVQTVEGSAGRPGSSAAAMHEYAIEPGPLAQTLQQAARTAGVAITFSPEMASGRVSQGLRGTYSTAAAFERLLAGTNLQAVSLPDGSYTLRTRTASGGVSELVPVVVQADDLQQFKDMPYQEARSVNVISRDDIERFRGTSVGDIFRGTPGVLVGELRNSGGLDINIRGMQGQGRVPVLVDGARQETTVNRGYSGVISRSYIDPDLIGGITIDKGPTMSVDGTGATGGLVSMRTIRADDIVKPGESFGFRLRGQAIGNNSGSPVPADTPAGLDTGARRGSEAVYRINCAIASICSGQHALPQEWGYPEGLDRPGTLRPKSWAGSLAVAKRWDRIDLVAAHAERRQGNYYAGTHGPSAQIDLTDQRRRPFFTEVRPVIRGASPFQAGERIPGTNYESKSTLLKATTYLPADQELELSFLRYHSEYSEVMPTQIVRPNLGPMVQPRNSEVTVNTYSGRYHWQPAEQPLVDLRLNLWHTRTRATNNSPSTTAVGLYNNDRETYRRTGLSLENTASLDLGAMGESQVRIGLSGQWEDVGSEQLTADNRNAAREGDRDELSAFVAMQYRPIPSVTLEAGLRHTRFKSNDDRPISVRDPDSPYCVDGDGDGACDPLPNRNRQSGTAPILSLSWEPGNKGLQFYWRYAEAYRMPSLFESTSGFSFASRPDIILRPEHARNREVGINFLKDGLLTRNDKLRLKFAYFRNQTSDYLTRTMVNLWEEGGSDPYSFTMRNIDSATFHGLEFFGGYDIGWLYTEFGVTKYNKIEVCHFGSDRVHPCNDYGIAASYVNNMVPPKWHANLLLGTRLLDRKLDMGVRATFMGQRTNPPQFENDTRRSFLRVVPWHKYKVFDFYASYRVNDNLAIDFNIDNFTDRYYLDALSLGLIPAPGRTARLSVTLQY